MRVYHGPGKGKGDVQSCIGPPLVSVPAVSRLEEDDGGGNELYIAMYIFFVTAAPLSILLLPTTWTLLFVVFVCMLPPASSVDPPELPVKNR